MAKISMSLAARFFRRLAVGYKAGLDLRKLVERESRSGPEAFKFHLGRIVQDLTQGETLAESMKRTDGYFNGLQCTIVQAGEAGGRLEQAFENLAEHYEQNVQFRRNFMVAIAWPMFELFAAVCIIGLLILAMGWVAGFSKAEPIDWFELGWTSTQYFAAYVAIVFLITFVMTFIIVGTMKGWFGLTPLRIAKRLPVLGGLIDRIALSRFAWAIEVTFEAGINVVEATRMALRATQNWYYTRLETRIVDLLAAGNELYKALGATNAFSEEFLMLLENGEITGQIPESMEKVARQYREEILARMKVIAVAMFFVVLGIVAIAIIICIITLVKKLYIDMIQDNIDPIGSLFW